MIRQTAFSAWTALVPATVALCLACSAAMAAKDTGAFDKAPDVVDQGSSAVSGSPQTGATGAEAASDKAGDKASATVEKKPIDSPTIPTPPAEQKPAATEKAAGPAEQKPADSASSPTPPAGQKPAATEKATGPAEQKPVETGKATPEPEKPKESIAKAAALAEPKPSDSALKTTTPVEGKPADSASVPAATPAPGVTAALATAPSDQKPASVAEQPLPPADPVIAIVRQKAPELAKGAHADDLAAINAFYGELSGPPLWVTTSGLTDKGKAAIEEIRKADDWGLSASSFDVPQIAGGSLSPEAAAEAEVKLTVAVLKYARFARGGRTDPTRISQLIDQTPPLRAPKAVLTDIAAADAPDAYLRSLHPKHEQFEKLRQVLLKLRGGGEVKEAAPEEDPALSVKIPLGGILKPGMQDPQIALLKKRLKVESEAGKENVYDDGLRSAVEEFQKKKNLRPDAVIGNRTRTLLNGDRPAQPQEDRGNDAQIQRVLVNMERWRWLPEDLGDFYVWDNVPEFLTRVMKNGKAIHTDEIIVGQPTWPTPSFSADMKTIVFHPNWGVPDGIKMKELLPLLRKSSGGGLFGIFGGGYSAQAVLESYQLRAYYNGRPVDPDQVDWSSADIRAYSFQQPPGPKNVLGDIKFMFPNSHDVYMHDTPERGLFSRSFRGLSHGCMRVEEPLKLAEILLGQDKGWSPDKVRGMLAAGSSEVQLDRHIPVHVTYFTAAVDDNGKLKTYGDFYGLDGRVASALSGKSIRFETPQYDVEQTAASDSDPDAGAPAPGRPGRKKKNQDPASLADAISGLFAN